MDSLKALQGKRLGFIIPRAFDSLAGGAETLAMQVAEQLQKRGIECELITTCSKDLRTWINDYPAGETKVRGLKTWRLPVDERDLETWVPLQIRAAQGAPLLLDEEVTWLSTGFTSTALYQFLDQEQDRFDAYFFAPYWVSLSILGSQIAPEKSYFIPCFHDEAYAYTQTVHGSARSVRGMFFNAPEEGLFARRMYGSIPGGVVGMGFFPQEIVTDRYFTDDSPYLLYLGRKETGKNVQLLVDLFIEAKNINVLSPEVKLVVAGGGSFEDLHRAKAKERSDIIDLQFVTEDEKKRLLRYAVALFQPSVNESFGIVQMESWLQATPVVVHGHCDVTRGHVVRSGGGLFFQSQDDFNAVASELVTNRELRNQLGQSGLEYVHTEYSWDAVIERFCKVYEQLQPENAQPQSSVLGAYVA